MLNVKNVECQNVECQQGLIPPHYDIVRMGFGNSSVSMNCRSNQFWFNISNILPDFHHQKIRILSIHCHHNRNQNMNHCRQLWSEFSSIIRRAHAEQLTTITYHVVPLYYTYIIPYNIISCCSIPYHTLSSVPWYYHSMLYLARVPHHTVPFYYVYHIISCCSIPYRIIMYHYTVIACCTSQGYCIMLYHIIPYHIISYRIMFYHYIIHISYYIILYHAVPYHTIPYHIISYHAAPWSYHAMPCIRTQKRTELRCESPAISLGGKKVGSSLTHPRYIDPIFFVSGH